MKALQVVRPRSFTEIQVPLPDLTPDLSNQLFVKTAWVSLCGSDIPFFTGSKRYVSYPLIPGAPIHECIGQVIESTSNQFKPGDVVVAIPEKNQGLAEYFIAQAAKTVLLPAGLGSSPSSCLIQPLSTVLNAVDRLGDLSGKSAVVLGLGSIGMMFCWLLKKGGAERIIGVDPLVERCHAAQKFGATTTISMRSLELVHAIRQRVVDWLPPDICVEAVGHQMETLNDSLELVKKDGTVIAFGVPDHNVYAVEYETFFRKNLILMAVVTPVWSDYLAKACAVYISHRAELDLLVTHTFAIKDAEKAFTLYERHDGGIIKALINATDW